MPEPDTDPGPVQEQEQRVHAEVGGGDPPLVDLLLARRRGGQHELVGEQSRQQDLAVHELGAVAVPHEGEVGQGAGAARPRALGRLDVAGPDDVRRLGVQQAAAGQERQREHGGAATRMLGHGSRPRQKPTLSRAVQYVTCGCDSKSLLEKLSWPKAFTSGSTPL